MGRASSIAAGLRCEGADHQVFLGDPGVVERALGVRELPVTFLVQPGGRISHRIDGARDWTDTRWLASWLGS